MPEQKKVPIADLPRTRPERFVSIYANHTEALPGFCELALTFSRIAREPSKGLIVEEGGEVILTWEHAIRVRDLLSRMVEAYEKQQGSIRTVKEDDSLSEEISPALPQ